MDEPGAAVDGLAARPPPRDCCRVDQAPGQMLRLQTMSDQRLQVGMPLWENAQMQANTMYLTQSVPFSDLFRPLQHHKKRKEQMI